MRQFIGLPRVPEFVAKRSNKHINNIISRNLTHSVRQSPMRTQVFVQN
jgi:hypothetical protein